MKRGFRWFGRIVMGLLVCLCLSSFSGAAPSQLAQNILAQVLIRPVLDSGSFQVGGETFQHILVPRTDLEEHAESDFAVYAWMFKSIGLERSKLKIPMMDLASITYLPDTRSKS